MDLQKQGEIIDVHKEMDNLKKEREAVYRQHESKLQKYLKELQKVSSGLEQRKQELEQEERKLLAAKESLNLEIKEVAEEQEKLERHKGKVLKELEYIREKNLQVDGMNLYVIPDVEEKSEQEKSEQEKSEQKISDMKKEEPETEQESGTWENVMESFISEAEKIFPEGKKLECMKELFCMEIGDKELRIIAGNPFKAEILAKREKNATLMKGISQLNKTQEEWEFSYQNNCLKCAMPFTEAVPAEMVIQKCAEALLNYFK